MGIEPTSSAWKAEVLPLNYARKAPKSPSRFPLENVFLEVADNPMLCGGGGRIRTYEG